VGIIANFGYILQDNLMRSKMLSTLNPDQRKALAGFLSIQAKAEKLPMLKKLMDEQSYGKVYQLIAIAANPPFPSDSFVQAGMMTPGLRNAHFFLIAMENSGNQSAIDGLTTAFQTHCWGMVADRINEKLTPDRQFSSSELQFASAPGDDQPCSAGGASGLGAVLMPIIGAGVAVGGFFSGTLPDFFEGDFSDFFTDDVANFFTDDVAGFFTGDVANFFTGDVAGAFTTAGDAIADAAKDVGETFEGGFNSVKDFFGGLF